MSDKVRQQSGNARRTAEANKLWDARRAEIERLYFECGKTQAEIGRHFECSQGAIGKHMRRWGHDLRRIFHAGHRNGRYRDGSRMRPYRHVIDKVECKTCASTERLSIHHKNLDHFDNRLENLEVLCVSCHMRLHKLAYWKAKREGKPTPKSNGRVGWAQ